MAPWGVRQGWSTVGEGGEAASPPRDTRTASFADEPQDEAQPPRRPRALSPSLPNLPGDSADARLPPAPWGDVARDGAAAGTTRAPAKRARTAPVSVAARVLAVVDAHERAPPSPFERWRERLRDGAENRAPRSGPGHAPSRGAGPSGARGGGARGISTLRGTDQARKTAPPVAPPPSLTWDQHAVFLQFPPTRRVAADDLPRGLAPATLTELYRRVEREQKRYFACVALGAAFPDAVAGDERHVAAERRWRARVVDAAFGGGPSRKGGGVAPRRATAARHVVPLERDPARRPPHETPAPLLEIGADLDLSPDLDPLEADADRPDAAPESELASPRRGDALAPLGAGAEDAESARARDAVSSLSPFCFGTSGVRSGAASATPREPARALDGAMTAAAFACLAAHAPDRRGRAWEVPFRVDAVPGTGDSGDSGDSGETFVFARLFDPLPSRDLSPTGTRARAAAYWDAALRARLRAGKSRPPRLVARQFRAARAEGGGSAFAVVAAETASAVAIADHAVAPAGGGDAAAETEAFRWEDAARVWAAGALAPRRARATDGAVGEPSASASPPPPPLVAAVARVAVADGTVVDVQAVDRAHAVRAGADPPPEASRALLADWMAGEETRLGEPPPGRAASEEAERADDGAERASAGGAAAEPWFHRGFDPDLAAATVDRVLRSIRETCTVPGRYVLAHRAGEATAELYRDADADADAAAARGPSAALPRRRGRPQTAPRTGCASGTAFDTAGPRAAARRRRFRGASARGDGAFVFLGVPDDEDEDVSEEDEPLFSSGRSAGRPERPVDASAREAVVRPAALPRWRCGPEPGMTYDFHAAYAELVAETSAATERSAPEDDADDRLFEVVPRAGAQRPPPGQIPFTFAPRGEPPQPGARRARKMWTSLLAPAHVTGDATHESLAGDVSRQNTGGDVAASAPGDVARDGDDKRPIPGAWYCHKFAHFGTCRTVRCPYPHLSLAEARAGADSVSAEARARRAAYENLAASAGSRRRNWAGT